jgi:hypothetical protein
MVKGERLDRWRSVRTASGTSAAAPVPARGDLVRAIVWLLTTARFGILLSQRGRSGRQRSVLNGDDRARQPPRTIPERSVRDPQSGSVVREIAFGKR